MNKISNDPIQVDRALFQHVEDLLADGESVASFVEQSIRQQIRERRFQREFVERGLRARERAKETGVLHSREEVLAELDKILEAGRKRRQQ